MEKSFLIIWNYAIKHKNLIIDEISKNFNITYVTQDKDILVENENNVEFLKEFYWNSYAARNYKERVRLTSEFILIFFTDLNPVYECIYRSQRKLLVNVNMNIVQLKQSLRKKIEDDIIFPICHCPDEMLEFIHNLEIISKYAIINNISSLISNEINECKKLLKNK
jgi:hypothetical protein